MPFIDIKKNINAYFKNEIDFQLTVTAHLLKFKLIMRIKK